MTSISTAGGLTSIRPNENSPGNPERGQILTAFEPSPEAVARRACAIYENQGSQPGHEVKHWLEAEAQLFSKVERESQIHPGASLFTSEH
jgi:hypothetical protein